MALTYGFYNSINGDRKYDAIQMSSIFDGIIQDGVFGNIGEHFACTAASGMSVRVGTGRAWFNHTWTLSDTPIIIPVASADLLLTRIDAVVLEINREKEIRANSIKYVKGTPSEDPKYPSLNNTGLVSQYPLCYICVPKELSALTNEHIENAVGTKATPISAGVAMSFSADQLINQLKAEGTRLLAEWTQSKDEAFVAFDKQFRIFLDKLDKNADNWTEAITLLTNIERKNFEMLNQLYNMNTTITENQDGSITINSDNPYNKNTTKIVNDSSTNTSNIISDTALVSDPSKIFRTNTTITQPTETTTNIKTTFTMAGE